MLILIVGLPGTGKTTFAAELAKEIEAVHLNSDMIRATLGKQGKYDSASKAVVYEELYDRATEMLKEGNRLIVDATLYKEKLRKPYDELARRMDKPIKWIELKADEPTIRQRVGKKREYSEADFEVYQKIKALYEPITQNHLVLRTDVLSLSEMVGMAKEYIRLGEFTSK